MPLVNPATTLKFLSTVEYSIFSSPNNNTPVVGNPNAFATENATEFNDI